jgi:hypothetical protein
MLFSKVRFHELYIKDFPSRLGRKALVGTLLFKNDSSSTTAAASASTSASSSEETKAQAQVQPMDLGTPVASGSGQQSFSSFPEVKKLVRHPFYHISCCFVLCLDVVVVLQTGFKRKRFASVFR